MAACFYCRPFAIDPSARHLFSQPAEVMAEKFAAELHAIDGDCWAGRAE